MLLRKHRKHAKPAKRRPRMQRRMRAAVALFGLSLGAVSGVHAQAMRKVGLDAAGIAALDAKWRESLESFAALDRQSAPSPGGIVFVGSSSIRMWEGLEKQFGAAKTIVKRGFGGSRLSDCARYVARLVLPYKPKTVVVYAGDNDLAEGATPEEVAESFRELVERIHAAQPETRIAYLSIKPSPSREKLMPLAIQANERIAAFAKTDPRLDYIDVYTRMLDEKGRPRAELFLPDALHLNAAGYAIWQEAIADRLR